MSELAFQETKKPKISSHDHSFSPIKNPGIVLEISAVAEYFGTIFNTLLGKKKKSVFLDPQKGQNAHQKTIFLIFLNKRIRIVPTYSGTADISKTVSGLRIEEKLWL